MISCVFHLRFHLLRFTLYANFSGVKFDSETFANNSFLVQKSNFWCPPLYFPRNWPYFFRLYTKMGHKVIILWNKEMIPFMIFKKFQSVLIQKWNNRVDQICKEWSITVSHRKRNRCKERNTLGQCKLGLMAKRERSINAQNVPFIPTGKIWPQIDKSES